MAERKAPQEHTPASEAWRTLPWKKFQRHVYRLQKRMYRASQRGNSRAVHKLQKLLMKSEAARMLAVRRVTQENRGKKTAGVDGVKAVSPARRIPLARAIHPRHWKRHKARPVRRVWIPKPGKAERRPLGIPTMGDRARQALVKMALEPEWEARFEPNSYGFRPGRSAQDAIAAIFLAIKHKDKFVLDADIQGCFDHINQEALLNKLQTYPALRRTVKEWLKAGVLEGNEFTAATNGTPQGGVISPLLANIALHGLETTVNQVGQRWEKVLIIRYADDFVLFHSDRTVLEEATREVERFLEEIGLSLHARKTRVTHTLTPYQGNVGFDFLGFTIRQYRVGKTHSGKNTKGQPLGFKTIIKPSREGIRRHVRAIKQQVKALRTRSQVEVIKVLNPIIRGWTAYYRSVIATEVFQRCDVALFEQLMRWSVVRHHGKGRDYAIKKYWRSDGSRKLVFKTPEDAQVRRHGMTKIERHVKVKGSASPYDGNLRYWSQRLAKHAVHYGKVGALLHRQDGCCCWCGLHFSTEDVIGIDHIDRNRANYAFDNLRALHRHCHDERHASRSKEAQERAAGINHT